MTTVCSKCGSTLAANADILFCPECGTPTPSNYTYTAVSSSEPTAAAATYQSSSETSLTDYGSNPHGVPLQNPYETLEPLAPPPPPPPPMPTPPSAPSRRPKLGVLMSIVVLVLIIIGVSVGALLILQAQNPPPMNASLTATAQAQTNSAATNNASAEKNPYAPNTGTLVLNDALTDNSKGYGWDEGTISDGSFCQFMDAAYYVNQPNTQAVHPCFALHTDYSNFTYELSMTILKGGCGGLVFMADSASSKYIVFDVCQDGTFSLFYQYAARGPLTLGMGVNCRPSADGTLTSSDEPDRIRL